MIAHLLAIQFLLGQASAQTSQPAWMCAPHTSVLRELRGLSENQCEREMREAGCEEFFAVNKVEPSARRNCSENPDVPVSRAESITNWALTCPKGLWAATVEMATAIGDGAEGLWAAYLRGRERKATLQKAMDECDSDPELKCKRALALDAGIKDASDSDLQKRTSLEWFSLVKRHQRAERSQAVIREAAEFSSLPLEEKKKRLVSSQASVMSSAEQKWAALKGVINTQLNELGIKQACYNGQRLTQMYCHGLGYIVDPTVVIGGGTLALKGLAGFTRVGSAVAKTEKVVEAARVAESASAAAKSAAEAKAVAPSVTEATRAASEALGFEPTLRKLPVTKSNDGMKVHTIEAVTPEGKMFGRMQYRVTEDGQTMWMDSIGVGDGKIGSKAGEQFKEKGMSKLFMAQAMEDNPGVKKVVASLADDNQKAIEAALKKGMECVEAFGETPAGKLFKRYGFTSVKGACMNNTYTFIGEKP